MKKTIILLIVTPLSLFCGKKTPQKNYRNQTEEILSEVLKNMDFKNQKIRPLQEKLEALIANQGSGEQITDLRVLLSKKLIEYHAQKKPSCLRY